MADVDGRGPERHLRGRDVKRAGRFLLELAMVDVAAAPDDGFSYRVGEISRLGAVSDAGRADVAFDDARDRAVADDDQHARVARGQFRISSERRGDGSEKKVDGPF